MTAMNVQESNGTVSLSITGEGEGEGAVTTGWATDPTCAAQLASSGKHSTALLLA